MEVTPGYKQTEAGVIPEDWVINRIIECADYVDYRGKTPTKTSSGILLVTAKNIRAGFIDYEISREYIAESEYESAMRRGKPSIGDILITTEAPLGMVALVDRDDIALAQRVIKYRGKSNKVCPEYLKFYFLSTRFQALLDENSSGSTAKGIKGSVLHQLPVILPPLPEQEAIAEILSKAAALIESLERLIAKKRLLKKGVMQQLLTGKRRLPGFSCIGRKNCEVGEIPSDWQVVEIGKIADVKTGPFGSALHERDYVDDGTPIITKITKREGTGSTSETRTALSVPGVQFERLGSQILFSFGGLMGHTRRRTKWTVLTKACPTRSGIANITSFSSPNIAARRSMGKFAEGHLMPDHVQKRFVVTSATRTILWPLLISVNGITPQ